MEPNLSKHGLFVKDFINIRLRLFEFAASHSFEELLQKTIDELETLTESSVGFFHFVESDQKTLSPQAWSTRTVKEFCSAGGKGMHYGIDQAGVWTDCVHQFRPVIHNDYASLPHRKGLPPDHPAIVRELVVPIIKDDRIVAILGVGNKPSDYTEEDVEIVSFLADVAWEIVDRKQTEETTQQEKIFSDSLINSLPGIFYLFDEKRKFLRWNKNFEEASGYSGEEIAGINPSVLFEGAGGELIEEKILEVFSSGKSYAEAYLVSKTGARTPYYFTGLRIQLNEIAYLIGVGVDITEIKQAKESLRESEKKYRMIAENTSDFIWILDLDSMRLTYSSPSVKKITGYTVEEHLNNSLENILTPQSLKMMMNVLSEGLQRNANLSGDQDITDRSEWQEYHKGGHLIWVEAETTFIRDDHGKPIGVIGVSRDISERKKAEDALRESEEKFRAMVENSPMGIAIVNDGYQYVYVNNKFCSILGYQKDDLLGNDFSFPLAEESREEAIERYLRRQRGEQVPDRYEFSFIRKSGEMRRGEVQSVVYRDNAGRANSLLQVSDITDRKRAEEEKAALEVQLQQARKLESIGTLAGGIAHDFNNILSAIIGYSELALDEAPEGSALYRDIREVLTAGNRAKELVKQILTFARHSDVEVKPIRAKYIIQEALKMLRSSIPSTIELQQYIASDAIISANTTQIHQMVMNLCTNAAHAMEAHGGILSVHLDEVTLDNNFAELYPEIVPGNYLQLSVQDTGHGMGQDIIEKIFEPYFTTKKIGEGTGLGLSVIKGIVQSCNGLITVKSELGKGCIFDVYLPVLNRETKVATVPVEMEKAPTGDEHILFVDDEPPIAIVGEQLLEKLGYQVALRTSALEALELFKTNPDRFDLVITDMTMPHMTGDVLTAEIRKIRPDIPVILCTGYSKAISDKKAKEIGINAFLMKPVVNIQLAKTVRKVLDEAK